jgi:arylsulfatase A-like enzyme
VPPPLYRAALCGLAYLLVGCEAPEAPAPRDLLIVSLDTTRRDHLSTYGYERETAPALDRLARGGALFENAISQWTATNPSHTSMFTGLYPHTHGVGTNTSRLPDSLPTLAEILRGAGFRTGAFVSGYTLQSRKTGIDRGFEVYEGRFEGTRRDGRRTGELAVEWLRSLPADERRFLFLHLYDAHGPYRGDGRRLDLFRSSEPGPLLRFIPEYQRRRDSEGRALRHLNEYVDRYDAEVRYQDEVMDYVLGALDLDRTFVVVVADHGETFVERSKSLNLSHATGVFDEQIRIPFVLHGPGIEASRFEEIVETVDLLPTALEILAVPPPPELQIQGESLVPLLAGRRPERADHLGFSSVWARRGGLDRDREIRTVRSRRWKLVVYPGLDGDRVRLFDLAADPGEREDVGDLHPKIRDGLLSELERWSTGDMTPAEEIELTPEDIEKLQALGYLN